MWQRVRDRGWLRPMATVLAIAMLAGCSASTPPRAPVVTDYGLGPDKWATAWLMARHAEPGAELVVVPQGHALPEGVAFDVPSSPLRRERDHAAFQSVIQRYRLADPALARMARIVRDIEVNYWGAPDAAESPAIEQAFRELQQRHGRYSVAPACYLAFFDKIYKQLQSSPQPGPAFDADALRVDCHALASQEAQGPLVPELSIATLLAEMKAGRTVRFVDVREPEEFVESHIPGALNIQLRSLDENALAQLRGADYVVSYCIKDFRGFEMARSLRDAGIRNAVILNPYGIKGWIAEGLPTAGAKALTSGEALTRLDACVTSPAACKADGASTHGGGSREARP
ncbi:chromate resistance protein [Lysobacter sp. 5GHs7-4]|uniref:chromate resistance protein ChrB domain-containing protein n=1 Tax=Lysobacter sp. 5GHs7-4 TaxID=2904253 RepID=UPI001E4E8707|nr:chromate resistance protein ChrB domain-containing protein [Lysobacter sp. 5GHs7-4]UHQ23392.1 chromate resistance protein [Lysobacter sp. 5GHs7-4]